MPKLENKAQLVNVLTYRVLPGKVMSTDLADGMMAKTIEGTDATVRTRPAVMVENANAIQADVEASNGVIHVIDTVIMPDM